jgi:hypothetical protein
LRRLRLLPLPLLVTRTAQHGHAGILGIVGVGFRPPAQHIHGALAADHFPAVAAGAAQAEGWIARAHEANKLTSRLFKRKVRFPL